MKQWTKKVKKKKKLTFGPKIFLPVQIRMKQYLYDASSTAISPRYEAFGQFQHLGQPV